MNAAHQCNFYYIGRLLPGIQGMQGKHSVVKFSNYEGRRLVKWLTPLLDQIHSFEDRDELIPFFGDGEETKARAFETMDKNDRVGFFKKADLVLATLKARIVFNRICGIYEIHLLNPVTAEQTEKHKGWPGPTVILREDAMMKLRRFIVQGNVDAQIEADGGSDTE